MKMRTEIINNLAFSSVAMAMVIEKSKKIELAKSMLIMPFLAHSELLSYLAKGKTKIKGLDNLIIEKLPFFSNFNKRYYDNLSTSINSLQFLFETDVISIENNLAISKEKIKHVTDMGERAKKVSKASTNLAKILSEDASNLYLNLRIEL